MIRPWYRSRLFWLGLPGLTFLFWAWGTSNLKCTRFLVDPGWLVFSHGKLFWYDAELGAAADDTAIYERRVDFRMGDVVAIRHPGNSLGTICGVPARRFHPYSFPIGPEKRRWFPPPRWRSERLDAENGYRFVSLPYWLIALAYTATWLGTMVIWQRRKARLSRRAALAEAGS